MYRIRKHFNSRKVVQYFCCATFCSYPSSLENKFVASTASAATLIIGKLPNPCCREVNLSLYPYYTWQMPFWRIWIEKRPLTSKKRVNGPISVISVCFTLYPQFIQITDFLVSFFFVSLATGCFRRFPKIQWQDL